MNTTDYQFMQYLNVTKVTLEYLVQLMHRLPIYTGINYDFLREQV